MSSVRAVTPLSTQPGAVCACVCGACAGSSSSSVGCCCCGAGCSSGSGACSSLSSSSLSSVTGCVDELLESTKELYNCNLLLLAGSCCLLTFCFF